MNNNIFSCLPIDRSDEENTDNHTDIEKSETIDNNNDMKSWTTISRKDDTKTPKLSKLANENETDSGILKYQPKLQHITRYERPKDNYYNRYDNYRTFREPKYENHKKTLCKNFQNYKKCVYGSECLFAHNLNEQRVDYKRQKVLDILNSNHDLSDIDIVRDKDMYRNMIILTKLCPDCIANKCPGGYNCRTGSCIAKYTICYNDLNYGNCNNTQCKEIHLTARGLKPYYRTPKQEKQGSKTILAPNPMSGVLLTELLSQVYQSVTNSATESSDSVDSLIDELNQEEIIEELDLDCDESIFSYMNLKHDSF